MPNINTPLEISVWLACAKRRTIIKPVIAAIRLIQPKYSMYLLTACPLNLAFCLWYGAIITQFFLLSQASDCRGGFGFLRRVNAGHKKTGKDHLPVF